MNIYCSEWSPMGVYRVVFAFECKKRNKSATRQERVKVLVYLIANGHNGSCPDIGYNENRGASMAILIGKTLCPIHRQTTEAAAAQQGANC